MDMDKNNINNCVSFDVRPLNLAQAIHNPRKKRTKFLTIAASSLSPVIPKPKPTRKPDTDAPKITRPCSECGKKFWSWKALFGHMRCHPERQWRGINPPSNFHRPPATTSCSNAAEEDSSIVTEEDHEVAACLLILANGPAVAVPNKWPWSQGRGEYSESGRDGEANVVDGVDLNSRFECSSCKKVFGSHQALGGHRASHKNVKGCYANSKNDGDEEGCCIGHKCSVCLRVFSSGQALGGHKRCHWEKIEGMAASGLGSRVCGLDLNFPAAPLVADDGYSSYSSRLVALDLRLGL